MKPNERRKRGPKTGIPSPPGIYGAGTDYSRVSGSEKKLRNDPYVLYAKQPPANRSASKTGSTSPKPPAQTTYTTTGMLNQTGNARKGLAFKTFTKTDRPDVVYHEYTVNGKRKVVGVKKNKNSLGA